jgi:hypothetical protein
LKKLQEHIPFGLTQFTQGACPPFQGSQSKYKNNCDQINQNILGTVTAMKPEVVILSAAWIHDEYPQTNEQVVLKLSDMVTSLRMGSPKTRVVIIGGLPRWASPTSSDGLPSLLRDYVSARSRIPPVYLPKPETPESRRLQNLDDMLSVAANKLGAIFIAPEDIFCNSSGCLTRTSDTPEGLVTFDYGHLNQAGSKFFIAHIRTKIFN